MGPSGNGTAAGRRAGSCYAEATPAVTLRRPVIAIFLDAVERSSLERWIAEGALPTLAGLRERSVRCATRGQVTASRHPRRIAAVSLMCVVIAV